MESGDELRVLVEKAQRWDRAALDELARQYEARLTPWIEKRLGAKLRRCISATELAQEGFLRVLRSLERFRWEGEASFWRWIQTIVLHTIQAEARKIRPEGVPIDEGGSSGGGTYPLGVAAVSRDPSPSKGSERQEKLDRLRQALSRLSPEDREIILLVSVKGIAIKEVAKRMGKTPDAVSMRLLRATRRLAKAWGELDSADSVRLPLGASLDPDRNPDGDDDGE